MKLKIIVRGIGITIPYGNNLEEIFKEKGEEKNKINDFTLPFHPSKLRRLNKFDKILLSATIAAINDYDQEKIMVNLSQVGLILTTSYGSLQTNLAYTQSIIQNKEASPSLFVSTISNAPLGNISILLGLKGVSSMLMGSNVLLLGERYLKQRKAKYVLVGGGDEYHKEIEASTVGDLENKQVLSEGGAVLLLEGVKEEEVRHEDIIVISTEQCLPKCLFENKKIGKEHIMKLFSKENQEDKNVDAIFLAFEKKDIFYIRALELLNQTMDINGIPIVSVGDLIGTFMGGSSIITLAFTIHCMRENQLPIHNKCFKQKVYEKVNIKRTLVIGYEKGGNVVSTILEKGVINNDQK